MLAAVRMAILRWLGVTSLAGCMGCTGSVANAPDGSAGAGDGSTEGDAATSSDAKTGDAGSADAACVTGSATFVLQAAPGSAVGYCLGAPGTCSTEWLAIRPADGGTLSIDATCQTQCGDCQPVACPALCALPSSLGDGGARSTWDGTYYATGTCGAGTACVSPTCAPAGNYVATFCGYAEVPDAASFGCSGSSTPTCVETPFAWPPPAGSSPVQGVLGTPM